LQRTLLSQLKRGTFAEKEPKNNRAGKIPALPIKSQGKLKDLSWMSSP
jgi:hypothetical protein